jgi:hypothetical protein
MKSKNTLKVLFAPSNIASVASITMEALNKNDGICAKGFAKHSHHYWSFGKNWTIINYISWRKNPFKRLFQILRKNTKLLQLIFWADIIHWQWDMGGEMIFDLHYKILKITRKPVFIEWLGSDIRIPEVVSGDNRYYKEACTKGEYSYKFESAERSLNIQTKFSKLNALPIVCPEMSLFLDRSLFPHFILLYQRIATKKFEIILPDINKSFPVVVHTPSDKNAKGTLQIRTVIASLKDKGHEFEYIEIHNKTRTEAMEAIRKADIFLDQFIIGGYGMAACEAMAMAKPVFCYLMPSVVKVLPSDCPIINTNFDDLEKTLEKFIQCPSLRYTTGQKSRFYVEKYHDADNIAKELIGIYKKALQKSK